MMGFGKIQEFNLYLDAAFGASSLFSFVYCVRYSPIVIPADQYFYVEHFYPWGGGPSDFTRQLGLFRTERRVRLHHKDILKTWDPVPSEKPPIKGLPRGITIAAHDVPPVEPYGTVEVHVAPKKGKETGVRFKPLSTQAARANFLRSFRTKGAIASLASLLVFVADAGFILFSKDHKGLIQRGLERLGVSSNVIEAGFAFVSFLNPVTALLYSANLVVSTELEILDEEAGERGKFLMDLATGKYEIKESRTVFTKKILNPSQTFKKKIGNDQCNS